MRYTQSIGAPVAGSLKTVAYTGTAGTSAATSGSRTINVRVSSDAHINIGGTATTSDPKIYADLDYQFKITPKQTVSAIQVSTGGNLEIYELS